MRLKTIAGSGIMRSRKASGERQQAQVPPAEEKQHDAGEDHDERDAAEKKFGTEQPSQENEDAARQDTRPRELGLVSAAASVRWRSQTK